MNGNLNKFAPLPLRLMIGISFIYHGLPKLGAGHADFSQSLTAMGVPAPELMAWALALLEAGGGLLLIVGLLTRTISVLLIIEMLVAIVKVHFPAGFSFMHIVGRGENGPIFGMPGYEVNLLLIAGLASLVLSGPGRCSFSKRESVAAEAGARESQRVSQGEPSLHEVK